MLLTYVHLLFSMYPLNTYRQFILNVLNGLCDGGVTNLQSIQTSLIDKTLNPNCQLVQVGTVHPLVFII